MNGMIPPDWPKLEGIQVGQPGKMSIAEIDQTGVLGEPCLDVFVSNVEQHGGFSEYSESLIAVVKIASRFAYFAASRLRGKDAWALKAITYSNTIHGLTLTLTEEEVTLLGLAQTHAPTQLQCASCGREHGKEDSVEYANISVGQLLCMRLAMCKRCLTRVADAIGSTLYLPQMRHSKERVRKNIIVGDEPIEAPVKT